MPQQILKPTHFNPENEGSVVLQNVDVHHHDYMVSKPRRQRYEKLRLKIQKIISVSNFMNKKHILSSGDGLCHCVPRKRVFAFIHFPKNL
jgi:hypothetical protein